MVGSHQVGYHVLIGGVSFGLMVSSFSGLSIQGPLSQTCPKFLDAFIDFFE